MLTSHWVKIHRTTERSIASVFNADFKYIISFVSVNRWHYVAANFFPFFSFMFSFRSPVHLFSFSFSLSPCELFGFGTQFSWSFISLVISRISYLEPPSLSFSCIITRDHFWIKPGPPTHRLHHHHHIWSDPKVRTVVPLSCILVFPFPGSWPNKFWLK